MVVEIEQCINVKEAEKIINNRIVKGCILIHFTTGPLGNVYMVFERPNTKSA